MTGDRWFKILFLEGDIVIKSNFLKELLLQFFFQFVGICKPKTNF